MSLYKISIRISWQDLCKGPLGKIPTDLYAMPLVLAKSLYKISIRGLLARSLSRAFWQDLNGSLCNVSVQGLFIKPQYKLSRRVLLARFV